MIGSDESNVVKHEISKQDQWYLCLLLPDIRFRSVVLSDILSERPATLPIILIVRLMGIVGMLKQVLNRPAAFLAAGDNEADAEAFRVIK